MGAWKSLRVDDTTVWWKGHGYPTAVATARVETSGDISRRITATRILTAGVFALAIPKKSDDRTVYLTVEGPGFGFVVEVDPGRESEARSVAVRINAAVVRSTAGWYAVPDGSRRQWWDGQAWTQHYA